MRARIALALAVSLLAGCAPLGSRAHTIATVIITRGQYVPGDDTNKIAAYMPQGDQLLVRNQDSLSFGGHTITSDIPDLFESGVIGYQESKTLDLSALPPGTYGFTCTVHYGMHGTLNVIDV